MTRTRRQLLTGAAAATAGVVAGCLGTVNGPANQSTDERVAQASFFVLADFASNVAGDHTTVRNLVPFGQHGHGWEPGPDVQRRVFDATAFVYMGEGFQPWADDIVQNLRDDDTDVSVIEARRGVDLLSASDEDAHDHSDEAGDDHSDEDGDDDATHDEDSDEHEDHDRAGVDPHFWLDPTRAAQAVENIAEGLRTVDGANESAYADNAASFTDRLTALDDTYRERLDTRTKDVVLVAGHNSFRYLADRYDFGVEALSGLSPDTEPTPRDVRRAQAAIEEHDIEYILAPVFESDRAARQLVAETSATEVLPLTPVPTLTEAWADDGWGYLDVAERVNLPSLATALGVE